MSPKPYVYPKSQSKLYFDELNNESVTLDPDETLLHYGRGHLAGGHSGRYPWGSGDERTRFHEAVDALKASGITNIDKQAKSLGLTRSELQQRLSTENATVKVYLTQRGQEIIGTGKSISQAAKELDVPDATLRNYLATGSPMTAKAKLEKAQAVKDMYVNAINKQSGYIDIGAGTEHQVGITDYQKKLAVESLKNEGYYAHRVLVRNLTNPDKPITTVVLTKDPDPKSAQAHSLDVQLPNYQYDGVKLTGIDKPVDVPWDQVKISYGVDGENDRDGTILVRRGVPEANLGDTHYAQVRISVGGTHYMKGMAMYGDDEDFAGTNANYIFHTNKPSTKAPQDVLKPQKDNPLNPFESSIRHQKGVFNIVNQEGDWNDYRTTLATQFLSKQKLPFVKERLADTLKHDQDSFKEISSITNPVIKKKLLDDLAGDPTDPTKRGSIDTEQIHMRAIGETGTRYKTLIANPWLKPNEVYAPDYNDGERVVLVRYPHGGTFELPDLVVNNKNTKSKKLLGNAIDGIGIHPETAKVLSGADFDGDTVIVVPNNKGKLKTSDARTSQAFKSLREFDPNTYELTDKADLPYVGKTINKYTGKEEPKTIYPGKHISPRFKQTEMGNVSNMITDMTIKGASNDELVRAVKYSMVVIDSEKHHLDWKQAKSDLAVNELQKKYMTKIDPETGRKSTGANTLLSVAKHDVGLTKDQKQELRDAGFTDLEIQKQGKSSGKLIPTLANQGKLSTLNSGSPVEQLYQDYVQGLQVIKNEARKQSLATVVPARNKEATKIFKEEVASLNSKIKSIQSQAPLERKAQIEANESYRAYLKANPDISTDRKKNIRSEMLNAARKQNGVDAYEKKIHITTDEWNAIQSNAISKTAMETLLKKADMDELRRYAMPKDTPTISPSKLASIQRKLSGGTATLAEIADSEGMSMSQLKYALASQS